MGRKPKPIKCWCCGEEGSCHYIKDFETNEKHTICGPCVGLLAVIESRLNTITRSGCLPPDLTAKGKNVPKCER